MNKKILTIGVVLIMLFNLGLPVLAISNNEIETSSKSGPSNNSNIVKLSNEIEKRKIIYSNPYEPEKTITQDEDLEQNMTLKSSVRT